MLYVGAVLVMLHSVIRWETHQLLRQVENTRAENVSVLLIVVTVQLWREVVI